jgi:hypothetical protein
MIRGIYDANNEHALLKFNGPYRLLTSGPSFNGEISPQGVQTTQVIKVGNVKIYGTPYRASELKENEFTAKD